jgi:hypothetical protein
MSMIKTLVLAAAFGLGASAASACDFQRSAELDKTVVASIPTEQTQSTPVAKQIPLDQLAIDQAVPVEHAE